MGRNKGRRRKTLAEVSKESSHRKKLEFLMIIQKKKDGGE